MPKRNEFRLSLKIDLQLDTEETESAVVAVFTNDANDHLWHGIEHALCLSLDNDTNIINVTDISLAAGHEKGTRRLPTIVEYFEDRLGVGWPYPSDASLPSSPAHPDFHIESGCGRDCANAIDAAVEAIRHVNKAFGEDESELVKGIVDACSAVVRCYVYG